MSETAGTPRTEAAQKRAMQQFTVGSTAPIQIMAAEMGELEREVATLTAERDEIQHELAKAQSLIKKAAERHFKDVERAETAEAQRDEPIDMLLYCPKCGLQHIDAPDERTPDWKNPPHKSHLCHDCKTVWRQSDRPTNGVKVLASGKDFVAPSDLRAELDAAKRALAELNNPSEELLEKLTETYSRHLSTANRGYAQHEEGMRDTLAVLAAALAAKSTEPADRPNNDEVICPGCTHQFRAIPVNVQRALTEMRSLLQQASLKLRAMGREFSKTNFTDRYGDGPVMLQIADAIDAALIAKSTEQREG